MTEPLATPDDVRDRLNIDLEDGAIQTYLEDAAWENDRVNDIDDMSDDLRRQIEWRLAAVKILGYRLGSRAYHQQSLGSMSRSYESRMLRDLNNELRDLDPSGNLGGTLARNGSRTITSTRGIDP